MASDKINSDKTKFVSNHCRYCGSDYSEELIKKIKQNRQPLFCEFCGEGIIEETSNNASELVENKNKDESSQESKEKRASESSTRNDNIIEQLKLFISRRIYELFKNPKYSVKLDKKSNELSMDQLNDMAKVLRTTLICQPIPEYWFKALSDVNLYDFMKYYEKFQESLKNKKMFSEDYLVFFRETIQFVHGLKRGTHRASELQGFNGIILKDLKKCYGFIRNAVIKGGFEWYLTIFLGREIYNAIRSSKFNSDLTRDQGHLKNFFTNRLAYIGMKSLESNQARKNWISRFKWSSKVKFLRKLENLLFELNSDHIYRQSFLEFLRGLIKTVFELMDGKCDFANLRGIKKIVAEHLIRANPFDNDFNLSPLFKSNLIMLLSRIIYLKIKYQENVLNRKASQMKLTKEFVDQEVNNLIESIISKKRLKNELLGNLYEISQKEFQEGYEKFRTNLRSDQIYQNYFVIYLRWLVKTVFKLISENYDVLKLSKTKEEILKHLVNFRIEHDFFNKIKKSDGKNDPIVEVPKDAVANGNSGVSKVSRGSKWAIFDWSKGGKPRTKEEALKNAAEYLIKNILTNDVVNNFDVRKDKPPTFANLNSWNHHDFVSAIVKRHLSWEKIKKIAGFSERSIQHILFRNKTLSYFSPEARNIISKYIFNLISRNPSLSIDNIVNAIIVDIKSNKSWTGEIPIEIINELKEKLDSERFTESILNYFTDLAKIVKKFKELNEEYKKKRIPINISALSRELLKRGIKFDQKKEMKGLYDILVKIFEDLKHNVKDFELERKIARDYYDNPVEQKRECKRCGEIKSYVEFGTRGEGKLAFLCYDCVRYTKEVLLPKKKIKIISHFFGINSVKCLNCNCETESDIAFLPTLDFHHKDPTIKEYTWRKLYNTRLEIVFDLLSREEIIALCLNCHRREHSNLFYKYRKDIIDENLFEKSPKEIETLINSLVYSSKLTSQERASLKHKIKEWIKKRSIIEQLYDGKCVGCGKINVENNLPSLSFHHRNPNVKERVWKQLKKLQIEEIADILRKEDAICLCSNCHRMIHFVYFKDKINEILTDSGLEDIDFYKKKNQEFYLKLFDNIKKFKFKDQKIVDPLKSIAQIGFTWERYLVHIYRITELKGKNEFTPKEMIYSLDLYAVHRRNDDPFINLINLGYIEKIGNTHKYLLTKSGLEKAKQLLEKLKEININDYNDLLSQVNLIPPRLDFKKDHEKLRNFLQDKIKASNDQWKKHLIHLFKIMEKKNENQVKSKELADSLDVHSTSVFSTGAMQTLIKKGFVQEIKSQSHRPNTFILTESGLNKAMELLREFNID